MQEQQKTFQTTDGTALFYRYRPAQNGNTRQAIILFHRGHEHSGRMMFVADELGFDEAIDYKNDNVKKALKQACPNGVDVFYDNVGGDILNDVLTQINLHARIVICGAISQYNATTEVKGPSNYLSLLLGYEII